MAVRWMTRHITGIMIVGIKIENRIEKRDSIRGGDQSTWGLLLAAYFGLWP